LERLYRRKVPPQDLLSPELARQLAQISHDLNRQVGVLLDRTGAVAQVIVGDAKGLLLPPLRRERGVKGRLKGLRLIHTHLDTPALSQDDLMDLALLRLDAVAALLVSKDGGPGSIQAAHLLPQAENGRNWAILDADQVGHLHLDFGGLVASLEEELARVGRNGVSGGQERAILIGVTGKNRDTAEDSMAELAELARAAGLDVAATIIQHRTRLDPRFLMGRGRLSELVIQALQLDADLLIFNAEQIGRAHV